MTRTDSEELVDLIYAAMLGEATWQHFLDALAARLPEGKATLFMHDSRHGRGSFSLVSGIEEKGVAAYGEYFSSCNPWMPTAAARPVGEGVKDHLLFPRDMLYKSEFYSDFLLPNEILASAGLTIERDRTFAVMLTTLSACFVPEETERMAQLLERLYPHLKRAANFYRRGPGETLLSNMTQTLFEAVDTGLIVWNDDLRITAISHAAQTLVDARPILRALSRDRTTLRDEASARMLEAMLGRLYQGCQQQTCRIDGLRVTLVRIVGDTISNYFRGPTVVAILESPHGTDAARFVEILAAERQLSGAERRVLSGLVEGKNTRQIASEAGRSPETIRSQTKALYTKLGVSGREEVLRRLLQGR